MELLPSMDFSVSSSSRASSVTDSTGGHRPFRGRVATSSQPQSNSPVWMCAKRCRHANLTAHSRIEQVFSYSFGLGLLEKDQHGSVSHQLAARVGLCGDRMDRDCHREVMISTAT